MRDDNRDYEKYATLPYIEGISQHIRRLFAPHNVAIHFKPNYTLKTKLTKLKDKVLDLKKANLIYEVLAGSKIVLRNILEKHSND